MRKILTLGFVSLSLILSSSPSRAAAIPAQLQGVGITEHPGGRVDIRSLHFTDENGKPVALSDYFRKGHPVILTLVYYECPNLCNLLLNGLVSSLRKLDWTAGHQFEIVTVSIDPRETPELARRKKATYLRSYGRPGASDGWHFLTGQAEPIAALSSQLGYQYKYDAKQKQFAHTSAIFLLTPDGKISRYLYGIEFPEKNLRLGLLEASNGRIGSIVDRVLLFCCSFDPKANTYTLSAWRVSQVFLGSVAVALFLFLAIFWRREKHPAAP